MDKKRAGTVPVLALALTVLVSTFPVGTVYAGQQNSYHDPLEQWVDAADRTGELDINAVVTTEISYCSICETDTKFTILRTPEYSKDGESAVSRGILFSDGTQSDGESKGIIRDGKVYTGCHWTKSVCTKCGSINSNTANSFYAYGRNVYILYDCAEAFMKPLEEKTEYVSEGINYHRVTKESGSYCGICYGTVRKETSELEIHHFVSSVTTEPGHSRFVRTQTCSECGYQKVNYVTAKSTVADYRGNEDGKLHSAAISNLSDSDVSVSILYGTDAGACTLKEAPSYKKAGIYTVYYQITYQYEGESMTENGTAYVELYDSSDQSASESSGGDSTCLCGDENCCCGENCDGTSCSQTCTTHDYRFLERKEASCEEDGFDRYICKDCGKTEKRNQTEKLGHDWQTEVIREADCTNEGKVIRICSRCGKSECETTDCTEHQFIERSVEASCTMPGYTVKECTVCGDRVIKDLSPLLTHQYQEYRVEADCLTGGHILHVCEGCGSSFITDYSDALGHEYSKGTVITDPSCTGSGVMEYECTRCGCKKITGIDSEGHEPGEEADCINPQTCVRCGAVIQSALGHDFQSKTVRPTETDMGYTLYYCTQCDVSYKSDYVLPVVEEQEEECVLTDGNGRASIGDYLVFVNDAESGNAIKNAEISQKDNGDLTVVLPEGTSLNEENKVRITVLNGKTVKPVSELSVSVSDQSGHVYSGTTGDDGTVTLPADKSETYVVEMHSVYMYGYPDGSFQPDGNMTRAEASAVFARLLSERRGEEVSAAENTQKAIYTDVPVSRWYNRYIRYLSGFGILNGNEDGNFRPDESITRSELTAIAVRFYNVYSSQTIGESENTSGFHDVDQSSWAYSYINEAYSNGWIQGYGDGTFRGENPITRAEMVSITNHLLNRTPDEDYLTEKRSSVVSFQDLSSRHWGYNEIMEAANGHRSALSESGETWINVNSSM